MLWRTGTADWNNVYSCSTEDEYNLRSLDLGDGTAIDIGAHIGGVTVGLALDNPRARIIAVECLSANVDLLRENIERNGLTNVTVLHAIASDKGGEQGTVRWNFDSDDAGQHHRFIANAQGFDKANAQVETVDTVSLADLAGGEVAFIKIDCEGGEYAFLRGPALAHVAEIRGEYHMGFDALAEQLTDTHVVTLTSGTESFGGFRAVRR